MTVEQQKFIDKIATSAVKGWQEKKILPSLCLAQAALESNWGKSGLSVSANNLFGYTPGTAWKGKVYAGNTFEYINGVRTPMVRNFRAYSSWAESVEDYLNLLSGAARYRAVIGERDYKKACRAVAAAGYATAPDYAAALIKWIETYGLTKYDAVTGTGGVPAVPPVSPAPLPELKELYKVRILPSAQKYVTGEAIPARVKGAVDTVIQVSRDGKSVLLKNIYSWVWLTDVEKI